MKSEPKKIDKTLFKGDQLEVFEKVINFFKISGGGFLLIKGEAGTGKTYIVQRILEHLIYKGYGNVGMLAPTGQAVKVCKENSDFYSKHLGYATLHSAFSLIPKYKEDELIFVKRKNARGLATKVKALFVDEVSQIENSLFKMLVEKVAEGMKVVLIGDEHQIPPINSSVSIPFSNKGINDYSIEILTMQKPIRQSEGNPILDEAHYAAKSQKTRQKYEISDDIVNDNNESVKYMREDEDEIYETLAYYFTSDLFKNDPYYIRVLAWKNKTVDYWNRVIRSLLYTDKYPKYGKIVKGELLLSRKPLMIKDEQGKDQMLFSTNEQLTVIDFSIQKYTVDKSSGEFIKFYETLVYFYDGRGVKVETTINIIHEKYEEKFQQILTLLSEYAKSLVGISASKAWRQFWDFKEVFLETNYAYAQTVHTAQGTTLKNAIVCLTDIESNFKAYERNRLIYTAVSRPKNNLIILY